MAKCKFEGSFYLNRADDYTLSDKKLGSDFYGELGGEEFDFEIDWIDLNEAELDNKRITKVDFSGNLNKPKKWTKKEIKNQLEEQIGWYMDSFTSHWTQDMKLNLRCD